MSEATPRWKDEGYPVPESSRASAPNPVLKEAIQGEEHHGGKRASHGTRTPRAYRICDSLTEALLYFMVVFSPWAFGSTPDWAIWVMNVAGYSLGSLLMIKWWVRWRTGYEPVRWGSPHDSETNLPAQGRRKLRTAITRGLATLTVLILAYCLISALNKRAIYDHNQLRYDYYECIKWLPHSYNANSTWFVFWTYLGLAWSFWAVRDWLLCKTRAERQADQARPVTFARRLPVRLRRLLWVLCINGALVGLESILQRLDGTDKLLWIREPRWNKTANAQFGPWAYRSNAAQYFNLLWPVCLGFWWLLHEEEKRKRHKSVRVGDAAHLLLLPCAVVMAACPIISTSRGGALVSIGTIVLAVSVLLVALPRENLRVRGAICILFVLILGLAGYLGWPNLKSRLKSPVSSYRTNYRAGKNGLTLRCEFLVPMVNPLQSEGLIGLSSNKFELDNTPNSIEMFLNPDGYLVVRLYGHQTTNFNQKFLPGFTSSYGGRAARVHLVKNSGLALYVNGEAVPTSESSRGAPPSWDSPISSSYFWVGRLAAGANVYGSPILSASFLNYPLNGSEVKQDRLDIPGPRDAQLNRVTSFGQEDIEFDAGQSGITLTEMVDGVNGSAAWTEIRRSRGSGPLKAQQTNSITPLRAERTARISFQIFNPNASDYYFSAGPNNGFGTAVLVRSRTEQTITTFYLPNSQSSQLNLGITDRAGRIRNDIPEGERFYLKDLRVEELGAVLDLDLTKKSRIQFLPEDLSGRDEIYENATRMAQQFPILGSGPGTFASVYNLSRQADQEWAAYAHNDWLELRITFGWVGSALFLLSAFLVLFQVIAEGSLSRSAPFAGLLLIALFGCLVHARFDFPFQIHSTFLLFLVTAVLLLIYAALFGDEVDPNRGLSPGFS